MTAEKQIHSELECGKGGSKLGVTPWSSAFTAVAIEILNTEARKQKL